MRETEPNNPTPRQKLNAQPIANEGFFKVDSWITGCGAFSVLNAKTVTAAVLSKNSAKQGGESQPFCGACFRPISRLASEIAISASEIPSRVARSAKRGLWRGNRNGVAA